MDKFVVNIIHRPEMVPEYSATVTGQGKEEDIRLEEVPDLGIIPGDKFNVLVKVKAAYKFSKYDTATPGGFAKIQKRARKGFDKRFGKQAAKLSQKQYDIITAMADVLRDMFGALVRKGIEFYYIWNG